MSPLPRALEGRCAIVTGASQGLGFAIANAYVAAGASVMICARAPAALDRAAMLLSKCCGPAQSVLALSADVSRPPEVAALVERTFGEFGRLDILVNNAGVAGPIGTLESVDWGEWMRAIEINLFGSVLLSRAVLPHFKQTGYGKIIQLSGGGATNPLPMLSAYAASKAAAVRFAETLAEETREYRIDVNSIAPGTLDTRMLDEFVAAGPERIGAAFHERAVQQKREGGVPLMRAASLAVFLGSAQSDGITGKLLSAVWDPWEMLPQHLADLRATDVYTLRRVVPADLDLPWDKSQ
jgi:NAD(P)-dependent dehydrogenase (short-subunit alcohol dehydrogenase family)